MSYSKFLRGFFYSCFVILFVMILDPFFVCTKIERFFEDEIMAPKVQKQAYENLANLLVVYEVADNNGPLHLLRLGNDYDGGYVVPEKACKDADVLFGYGIANDISFEEKFSAFYHKPSYGFDCGVDSFPSKNKYFTFVSQCIGTDKFLYDKDSSSQNISSFIQQVNNLGLQNKKIFIKMDIEGAEYEAFDGILKASSNVTGIVLEIHFIREGEILKAIKLLSALNKDFLLLHVHGNNYEMHRSFSARNVKGLVPKVLELTYINKALVTSFKISNNQSHPVLLLDMPNNRLRDDCSFELQIK